MEYDGIGRVFRRRASVVTDRCAIVGQYLGRVGGEVRNSRIAMSWSSGLEGVDEQPGWCSFQEKSQDFAVDCAVHNECGRLCEEANPSECSVGFGEWWESNQKKDVRKGEEFQLHAQ